MEVSEGMLDGQHREFIEHYLFIQQPVINHHPMTTVRFRNKKCWTGLLGVTFLKHSFVKQILKNLSQYMQT
jgi:hypothetical protein